MTDTTDLVRRLRFSANGSDYWSLCMEAADRIEQLEQEAAANKQDAMRYRFAKTVEGQVLAIEVFRKHGSDALDAAIDTTMKEKP